MELVGKYKNIIECKKSDIVFLAEKITTWRKITDEFNSTCTAGHREMQTLKSKYENIKKTTKKKFAEEKRQTYITGGGKSVDVGITDLDNMVHGMLKEQITGLESFVDSDTTKIDVTLANAMEEDTNAYEDIQAAPKDTDVSIIVWENIPEAPTNIAAENISISHAIKKKKKMNQKQSVSSNKWQVLAEEKMKVVREKRQQQEERHHLEMKLMQEQSELQKQQLQEEHKLRLKLMQEEAELQKEKLELEILSLKSSLSESISKVKQFSQQSINTNNYIL